MTDVRTDVGGIPSGDNLSHVMLCWHGSMDLHETVKFQAISGMRAGLQALTGLLPGGCAGGIASMRRDVCRIANVASLMMKVEVNR